MSFEHNGRGLCVTITNDGATLRDAGITFLVPKSCGPPFRWKDGNPSRGEGEREVPESLTGDGEPSHRWHGKSFHVLGGGNETALWFVLNAPAGEYPIRLHVYDDADRPRSLDADGTFTVPPREIDWENRSRLLALMRDELNWNRAQLRRALGRGNYESPEEGKAGGCPVARRTS